MCLREKTENGEDYRTTSHHQTEDLGGDDDNQNIFAYMQYLGVHYCIECDSVTYGNSCYRRTHQLIRDIDYEFFCKWKRRGE